MKCQSCGMPMEVLEDFGGGNTSNLYCKYCTDPSGNLLPRETVKERMTSFYVKAMNETPEEAAVKVDQIMASMPAWQQTPATSLQPEATVPGFSYEPTPVPEQPEPLVAVVSEPEMPLPQATVDQPVPSFTSPSVPFSTPASPEPISVVPEPSLPEPVEPQIVEPVPVNNSPFPRSGAPVEEKVDDEIPLPQDPGQ